MERYIDRSEMTVQLVMNDGCEEAVRNLKDGEEASDMDPKIHIHHTSHVDIVKVEERAERKRLRKEKRDKLLKNIGEELHFWWKCLIAALRSLTTFYISPWAVVETSYRY